MLVLHYCVMLVFFFMSLGTPLHSDIRVCHTKVLYRNLSCLYRYYGSKGTNRSERQSY